MYTLLFFLCSIVYWISSVRDLYIQGAVVSSAVCVYIQVIDEFSVHRTTDIRDSVDYLTLFTRQLLHHYAVSVT